MIRKFFIIFLLTLKIFAQEPKWLEDLNKDYKISITNLNKDIANKQNKIEKNIPKISSQELSKLNPKCQKNLNLKSSTKASFFNLLDILHLQCDFSIVMADQVAELALKKSAWGINAKNLKLEQILDIIVLQNDLDYTLKDNILKISGAKTEIFHLDYMMATKQGQAIVRSSIDIAPESASKTKVAKQNQDLENEDNLIKIIEKIDFWQELETQLQNILNINPNETKKDQSNLVINPLAGVISITARPSKVALAKDFIQNLSEKLLRQIAIDVSILAVDISNEKQRGIDWSKFELGFNSYIDNTPSNISFKRGASDSLTIAANVNFSLDGLLNFLDTNGKTHIISRPHITTLNNQQALISVGDNINYRTPETTEYDNSNNSRTKTAYHQYSIFVGVLLNITAQISDNEEIILRINPSLSNLKYQNNTMQGIREIAPDTTQKKLSSTIKAKNGETIILGGLIQSSDIEMIKSVPLLSSMPIFGWLFDSKKMANKRTELIFVITPRII